MEVITSNHNTKVGLWRSLSKGAQRKKEGLYLIEGRKFVQEALEQKVSINSILLKESMVSSFSFIINQLHIPVFQLADHVFDSVANSKTPQGVLAVLPIPTLSSIQHLGSLVLILDEVQDPGNVGTLIRTADATGFTGVLLSHTCADIFSPKVLQSTMGSVFHLPFAITSSLPDTLQEMHIEMNYQILGATLNGFPFMNRSPLSLPLGLVIGNEGKGISPEVIDKCTHLFQLPMKGKAESLNAAIAGGIMMYDLMKLEGKNL